jgi:hypothetical protein
MDFLKLMLTSIKKWLGRKPELPGEDPYAYVMAPKKPGPPHRSAFAVAELPE